jgi:hypothetical protein
MFTDLCTQFLNILHRFDYQIPKQRLRQMTTLVQKADVYHVDYTEAEIIVDFHDTSGNILGNIHTTSIPQVIDSPPKWIAGRWCDVTPIVLIASAERRNSVWTEAHELCHLLSIGPYNKAISQYWHHTFGIFNYLYHETRGALEQVTATGHDGINELMNDYVTWKLLQIIQGPVEPPYLGVKQFTSYIENCGSIGVKPEHFIGWYFSGNTANLQEILLVPHYTDFNELYEALRYKHESADINHKGVYE